MYLELDHDNECLVIDLPELTYLKKAFKSKDSQHFERVVKFSLKSALDSLIPYLCYTLLFDVKDSLTNYDVVFDILHYLSEISGTKSSEGFYKSEGFSYKEVTFRFNNVDRLAILAFADCINENSRNGNSDNYIKNLEININNSKLDLRIIKTLVNALSAGILVSSIFIRDSLICYNTLETVSYICPNLKEVSYISSLLSPVDPKKDETLRINKVYFHGNYLPLGIESFSHTIFSESTTLDIMSSTFLLPKEVDNSFSISFYCLASNIQLSDIQFQSYSGHNLTATISMKFSNGQLIDGISIKDIYNPINLIVSRCYKLDSRNVIFNNIDFLYSVEKYIQIKASILHINKYGIEFKSLMASWLIFDNVVIKGYPINIFFTKLLEKSHLDVLRLVSCGLKSLFKLPSNVSICSLNLSNNFIDYSNISLDLLREYNFLKLRSCRIVFTRSLSDDFSWCRFINKYNRVITEVSDNIGEIGIPYNTSKLDSYNVYTPDINLYKPINSWNITAEVLLNKANVLLFNTVFRLDNLRAFLNVFFLQYNWEDLFNKALEIGIVEVIDYSSSPVTLELFNKVYSQGLYKLFDPNDTSSSSITNFDRVFVNSFNFLLLRCPSTFQHHLLMVPANIIKFDEALQWVNNDLPVDSLISES